MKKVSMALIIIMLVLVFSGCEKDLTSEGVSKLTHYVTFDLTGGDFLLNPKGTAFVDPGIIAMEGTTDVSSSVSVTGSVNTGTVGLYVLTYSATNVDGFPASVSRSVIVYDPAAQETDLSGNYLSDVARISPARAFTGLNVTITKLLPGFFTFPICWEGFMIRGRTTYTDLIMP
jgi:hypothetical protein